MKRTPLRASLLITACITLLLIAGGIGAPTLGALPVSPAALSAVTDASPSAPARRPVNVILFIGDGMGYGQLSLGAPAIACMPIQTRVTTHALGGAVTDSAAAPPPWPRATRPPDATLVWTSSAGGSPRSSKPCATPAASQAS